MIAFCLLALGFILACLTATAGYFFAMAVDEVWKDLTDVKRPEKK